MKKSKEDWKRSNVDLKKSSGNMMNRKSVMKKNIELWKI